MKRSRFSEEQIIGILREQEAGSPSGRLPQARGVERDVLHLWTAPPWQEGVI